jgi:hypothetical protein
MIFCHVDLDNLWNYENEYGIRPSGDYDLIYSQALPLMIEIFDRHRIKATFFVTGHDLEKYQSCQKFCRSAVQSGHEVANHSFSHRGDFFSLSLEEKEMEILKTHQLIEQHTGIAPVGFRAPGYYLDEALVRILRKHGYLYESSVLPSSVNFLMKIFIKWKSKNSLNKVFGRKRFLITSQRLQKIIGGGFSGKDLIEFPITTLPVLRFPIHTSFVYLLGDFYRRLVVGFLKRKKSPGIYLFHAIDSLPMPADPDWKKVVVFKWSLERRASLIQEISSLESAVKNLSTRDWLSALEPGKIPASRVLRF